MAKVLIGGRDVEVESWSVQEDSTPMSIDDSFGGVGSFEFTTPHQDDLFTSYGQEVEIIDGKWGRVVGHIDSVTHDDASGLWTLAGPSRLGLLNIYEVQAEAVTGTLQSAVRYYLGLAGIKDGWTVEDDVKDIPVVAPGWHGELWVHLKQMLAAHQVEMSLTNGVIRFRKPRGLLVEGGWERDRTAEFGPTNVARAVEVYCYQSKVLQNEPVYPKWGHFDKEDIISFSAGELQEFQLELSASVKDFTMPTQAPRLSKNYRNASRFSVSSSNGQEITVEEFQSHGGYFHMKLNEDRQSFTLWLRGPVGLKERDTSEGKELDVKQYDYTVALRDISYVNMTEFRDSAAAKAGITAVEPVILFQKVPPAKVFRREDVLWVDTSRSVIAAKVWRPDEDSGIPRWVTVPAAHADANNALLSKQDYDRLSREVKKLSEKVKLKEGNVIDRFYLANGKPGIGDATEDTQYPTLVVLGSGVEWVKEKFTFPTGVPDKMTDNEVGITIDSPFIQDADTVARTGTWLASRYSMADVTLSGTSTFIAPTNDRGVVGEVTYQDVQNYYAGMTGDQVVHNNAGLSNKEHEDSLWNKLLSNAHYNSIGNAAGARFFDKKSGQWFRIREAKIATDSIEWQAELDTTHDDLEETYRGKTYGEVQAMHNGLTYQQVMAKGTKL